MLFSHLFLDNGVKGVLSAYSIKNSNDSEAEIVQVINVGKSDTCRLIKKIFWLNFSENI